MTDSIHNLEDLQQKLMALRQDNEVLLGLMIGGYAYFLRQFMVGHQSPDGLSQETCEQTIIDALKRILSTQERFSCEYLTEIEASLEKMTQTVPLKPYLNQMTRGQAPED